MAVPIRDELHFLLLRVLCVGTAHRISPGFLVLHRKDELQRHTHQGALKVVVYEGQDPNAGVSKGPTGIFTAHQLAATDVVLTTYDVLRKDLHHQSDPLEQQRSFRSIRKYEV